MSQHDAFAVSDRFSVPRARAARSSEQLLCYEPMAVTLHGVFWALAGGALIGLAATTLWFGVGRVAGVTGLLHGALRGGEGGRGVRVAFVLGLALAGLLLGRSQLAPPESTRPLATILLA